MKIPKILTFIDVETTGLNPSSDRIIEIAAIRIEDGQIVKTIHTFIDPERDIPSEITAITGIQNKDILAAPSFYQIAEELLSLLDNSIFVAHNVRFDFSFVRNEFSRLGYTLKAKQLCTVKLSRSLYPDQKKHDLGSIIRRFGFVYENRHRAYDDVFILWQFYQQIMQSFPLERIEDVLDTVIPRPALPVKLSSSDLSYLPPSAGVYLMYGLNDLPLYIGKSVHIRDRVLSHFSADYQSSTEMKIAQQVERIDTIQTVGELGALILESNLIKKYQPLYNHKLRNSRQLRAAYLATDDDGFYTTTIRSLTEVDPLTLDSLIGIFKSQKQVKECLIALSEQYQLCEKRLGIEKTSGACFAHRLGRCLGACVKQESSDDYNKRFINAVSQIRLKRWPYSSPVMCIEGDSSGLSSDFHVIDHWCYIGTARLSDGLLDHVQLAPYRFDYDLYKVLCQFIFDKKKHLVIRPATDDVLAIVGYQPSADNNIADFPV
ncbi:hypothetical protein HGA91_00945 [candidate division WWE3 bacterium]|nr:hypothetical protein [candidate division WWE3 bacterium]